MTGMTEEEVRALPAVVSLHIAGRAWGLGRTACYELQRAGEFPCEVLKIGQRFKVTRSAILTALGLADDPPGGSPPETPAQPAASTGYVIVAVPVSMAQLPDLLAGPLARYVQAAAAPSSSLRP
jgi:hypothetical protein